MSLNVISAFFGGGKAVTKKSLRSECIFIHHIVEFCIYMHFSLEKIWGSVYKLRDPVNYIHFTKIYQTLLSRFFDFDGRPMHRNAQGHTGAHRITQDYT